MVPFSCSVNSAEYQMLLLYFHTPVNGFQVGVWLVIDKNCITILLSCLVLHCVRRKSLKDADVKCPRTAANPSTNDHWAYHVTIKNSPDTSGRTKNEHMKSPRAVAHPAPMIIWGFHVTIKNSPDTSGHTKNEHMKLRNVSIK